MRKLLFVLLPLLLLAAPVAAKVGLVFDLTPASVEISESFNGARVTIFGSIENPKADVVIAIEGPSAQALVREKKKVHGVWINGESTFINPLPSFIAISSSKKVQTLLPAAVVLQKRLHVAAVVPNSPEGEAIIQDKTKQNLYQQNDEGVVLQGNKLFRAHLDFPPDVPVGQYHGAIYEIINGKIAAEVPLSLTVQQVGLAGAISDFARRSPGPYAIIALVLALGLGGLAAYVFRRV